MRGLAYQRAWLTIAAIAFEPVVDFYRQFLAQEPDPYQPGIYAEFRFKDLSLGIFKPKVDHQSEFAQSAQSGLSLCFWVEDLDIAIAQYADSIAHLAHTTAIDPNIPPEIHIASHGREAYLYDPAGNRLILYEKAQY